jgi:hypothetical protein
LWSLKYFASYYSYTGITYARSDIVAFDLGEKHRYEGESVEMAAEDDDCYLSSRHELNVVHCLPPWTTSTRCADLAYKPRSEKKDAEVDKTVLSAPENSLCSILKVDTSN